MDVTNFVAKHGKYPNWGNVTLADQKAETGVLGTKAKYDSYVEFLEDWDAALEEDNDRDPDKCNIWDTANVGYGPDEIILCGHSSTKFVTYESYDAESDKWYNVQQKVCAFHAEQIMTDTGNSDDMRNVHVQDKLH